MFFELLTEDEQDQILNEMGSSNLDQFKSRLHVLYFHMLKYQYQKEIQSSSWIKTIIEQSNQINYLMRTNKSMKSKINDNLIDDVYGKAVRTAISSSSNYTSRYGEPKFPSSKPEEYSLDNVSNINYIRTFLVKYQYTDEVKKYIERMNVR